MTKIRILIVDDSVVVRALLIKILSGHPDLEIVGVASNGIVALERIAQLRPDIIILDLEMPEMDGFTLLGELQRRPQHIPTIVFSSLSLRGAAATIDALSLGAADYVTKPSQVGGMKVSTSELAAMLVEKIQALAAKRQGAAATRAPATPTRATALGPPQKAIEIVVVGASTGGPNALADVLVQLPASFPVPIVIVQHMPPIFTTLLAKTLDARSALTISEAQGGERLERGCAYIAPGDFHLEVAVSGASGAHLLRTQDAPVNSCRPSVDVLFTSVAKSFGPSSLAVILTGMGKDGLSGCEAIHRGGGRVLAQDEASSVVWGMPGYVARAGFADQVLPLTEIGQGITRMVAASRGELPKLALRDLG